MKIEEKDPNLSFSSIYKTVNDLIDEYLPLKKLLTFLI